jgi:hypothetical protein
VVVFVGPTPLPPVDPLLLTLGNEKFAVHDFTLVCDQSRVALPPEVIVEGIAVKVTAGNARLCVDEEGVQRVPVVELNRAPFEQVSTLVVVPHRLPVIESKSAPAGQPADCVVVTEVTVEVTVAAYAGAINTKVNKTASRLVVIKEKRGWDIEQ